MDTLLVNLMAIYQSIKIQAPTGNDYTDVFGSRARFEKGIRDKLLNQALKYKGPKNSSLSFDLGLRYDFIGNPEEPVIALECLYKEEYLASLEKNDAIRKLEFLLIDSSAGQVWTARVTLRPERLISYFEESSKKKNVEFFIRDGHGYIKFGYGEKPLVKIAKDGSRQCKFLLLLFRVPAGTTLTVENVYSELPRNKSAHDSEINKINSINNIVKEILRKLKRYGYGKTIKFVTKKPKTGRGVCYMILP